MEVRVSPTRLMQGGDKIPKILIQINPISKKSGGLEKGPSNRNRSLINLERQSSQYRREWDFGRYSPNALTTKWRSNWEW